MDGFRLSFIERLGHFGWLRWAIEEIVVIKVVDKVKTKRCNGLHTSNRLK